MFASLPSLYIEIQSLKEMILKGRAFGKVSKYKSDHEGEAFMMGAVPLLLLLFFWEMRIKGIMKKQDFYCGERPKLSSAFYETYNAGR